MEERKVVSTFTARHKKRKKQLVAVKEETTY